MTTRKLAISWWLFASLCFGPMLSSCANKSQEETADAEGYEETVTESEAPEGGDTADNSGFDESGDETKKDETVASEEGQPAATETTETAKKDSDFEPLADDDFENLSFDEQGAKGAAATEEAKPAETAATPPSENLGDSLFSDAAGAAPAAGTSDIGLGATPGGLEDPVDHKSSASKVFRASVMPKIPQEAVSKNGTSLNRYYFLRKGDNPNTVATLIYGEEGRAEDLTTWNSTAWVPGNLIYYVSAQEAGDMQMRSLYEERNLKPTAIKVKRGESISQIALKRLGHVNSWKELAVVNSLDRPDSLTKGQSLNYYPDLGEAPAVAAAPVTPPPVAQPVTPPPPPPPVTPPPPMAEAAKIPPAKLPDRKEKTDVNISKLLKQNLFFITMGLGVGLLLLALVAINRKKRDSAAGGEEFNEDAFAPPRKKRR